MDTGEDFCRKKECEMIYNSLIQYELFESFPAPIVKLLCKSIERSIYNHAIKEAKLKSIPNYWTNENFCSQYSSIGYDIKLNLDPTSSVNKNKSPEIQYYSVSRIYNFLLVREFRYLIQQHMNIPKNAATQICSCITNYLPVFLPSSMGEMGPNDINPLINKPYIDQLKIREQQETIVKHSSMYPCPTCGERKAIIYELQTCSLDEGGTLFVKCMICNGVWTAYG
jgi:DNA-directed RNA polymerase subunit M/transcription elongation factor TFIIS